MRHFADWLLLGLERSRYRGDTLPGVAFLAGAFVFAAAALPFAIYGHARWLLRRNQ